MYRPKIHEDKTIYEWVQMASKVKVSKRQQDHDDDVDDDELDVISEENTTPGVKHNKVDSDAESDDLNLRDNEPSHDYIVDDDTEDEDNDSDLDPTAKLHSFLKEHPLYKTHKASFDDRKHKVVPNFVGGSLPRCDRGDREYYCATMLTPVQTMEIWRGPQVQRLFLG
jgi:hypothetical protein